MSENDVYASKNFTKSNSFAEEGQATFHEWLHANAVIASLFIVMFVALVLAGKATKATHAFAPNGAATNVDLSAASKRAGQDEAPFSHKLLKTIDRDKPPTRQIKNAE
jgi:hypothetical protein